MGEEPIRGVLLALGRDPAADGLQITTASGDDSDVARAVSQAITEHRVLALEYYKENEDDFSSRRFEPYGLLNSKEGWYVHAWDLDRDAPRSFRLDRIRSVQATDETFEPRPGVEPDVSGWPTTGEVDSGTVARVWISPDRARWERENRRVVADLSDGAVIVELPFASDEYLAREILKEAGDAVVLEPDDARRAVLEAAEAVAGAAKS